MTELTARAQELRAKLIRNFHDAPKEHFVHGSKYESHTAGLSDGTAAVKLGFCYDIVPPGKRGCPYHFHYAQEELFIILEGTGTLRVAGELIPVRAGDVITIPAGPQYPHHILNTSDAPLKYFSLSTNERPEVCEYPDSGKYGVFPGRTDGPVMQGRRLHRADSALDYWDGEE
jgi:uncharacterized cupin superfamily protein